MVVCTCERRVCVAAVVAVEVDDGRRARRGQDAHILAANEDKRCKHISKINKNQDIDITVITEA